MDLVEQVREAAGGSLLDAALGGDRREAATIAARARRRYRNAGDPAAARAAVVGAGLAALLAGHAGRAERLLGPIADAGHAGHADRAAVDDGAGQDPTWAQAVLYRKLARWHRWLLLPGGGGNLLMTECVLRFDLQGSAAADEPVRAQLLTAGGGDPRWQLEVAQVFDVVWCLTNVDGSELATGGLVTPDKAATILGELARRLDRMAGLADPAGAAIDRRLAHCYLADVARALNDGGAVARLQATYDEADAAGDHVMAATCLLRAAEWRAAPLGGAHVLDLAVQEPGDAGIDLAPPHEAMELRATGADADAVAAWVDEAAARFARAGAPRGRASAALHQSFLAFLHDRPDRQSAAAADARRWARAAGDRRIVTLAWVHALVADLAAGGSPLDRSGARRVGRWGRGEGSYSYALGVGLLLCRLARHWLTRRDEPRGAELLLRVAHEVFTELGADTNRLQAAVGSGDAVGAVGITLEQASRYRRALEGYLDIVGRRRPVHGDDVRRARLLAGTVHGAALATRDPRRVTEAGELIERTLAATGGPRRAHDLVELLRSGDHRGFEHDITGIHLAQALIQVPVVAAVLAGQRARRAGDDDRAAASFDEALAATGTLDEAARPFWRAFVLSAADRVEDAAAAYDAYLEGGGHDRALFDELTAPLAQFGPAGSESARSTAHANDRDAARFYASLRMFERARTHLDAAARASGDDWWRRESPAWDALALIADVDAGLGDPATALARYGDAVAMLEQEEGRGTTDEERSALGGRRSAVLVYAGAAMAAARLGEDLQAIDLLERSKARALVDLVRATQRARSLPDDRAAALRRWRQLTARAGALRSLVAGIGAGAGSAIPAVTGELDGLVAEIDALSPGLIRDGVIGIGARHDGSLVDVDQIAASLAPGTALVTWLETRDQLLTGVVTAAGDGAGGDVVTRLQPIASDEVTALLNRFTAACRTGDDHSAAGQRLARLLLEPLRAQLEDAEHVVFVPWGAGTQSPLHVLPFDGAPLTAERAVSYLPTAGLVPLLRRQLDRDRGDGDPGAALRTMLAIGDPDGMRWQAPGDDDARAYPPLPFARTEARLVTSGAPSAVTLVGSAATESAVRAALRGQRVVHLATHGCLVDGAPQLSAVLLAGGEHLTVDELVGLDLDTDLVVLSACDTGRGEVTDGNEVLGLARALLGVGSAAAVVSLWKAADLATCLLMRRFYDNLRRGIGGPSALAQAQRDLAATSFDAQLDEYLALPEETRAEASGSGPSATRDGALATSVPSNDTSLPYYWAAFAYLGIA